MLVTQFIIEASRLIPYVTISLSDEGDYILCRDIFVKDGKVTPNTQKIADSLRYWKNDLARDMPTYAFECTRKINIALESGNFFAKVDPEEYKDHPSYGTVVMG